MLGKPSWISIYHIPESLKLWKIWSLPLMRRSNCSAAKKKSFARWRHHWHWHFDPNNDLTKSDDVINFENLNSESYHSCWYEVNVKNHLISMYLYKVIRISNLSHSIRDRPVYQNWWRHSRCCSQAKFKNLFFSKDYLKFRKT